MDRLQRKLARKTRKVERLKAKISDRSAVRIPDRTVKYPKGHDA